MRKRFHGLKRLKIRQSWSKYNLYNLSRAEIPRYSDRTFFQQKWTAKALTRAYHGETIREKKWQMLFRPGIRSVVPMDHRYLARSDGSEQALGRGSGLEPSPEKKPKPFPKTPYMNMVYAPIERRLDTAIFRSLFASSTRQARQFVVHGYVKVNGKKMIYPGYQLNPGDMFQVEPERVLYATGAPKDAKERRATRVLRRKKPSSPEDSSSEPSLPEDSSSEPSSPHPPSNTPESSSAKPPAASTPKETLTSLLTSARSILSAPSATAISAKRKQDLRAFQRTLKRTLSRPTSLTDSIEAQLLEMTAKLNISPAPPSTTTPDAAGSPFIEPSKPALTAADQETLKKAIEAARDNPIDASKPYATPWRPREYMSAFAFVPRYLEVHHRICSAVYLRHPVARPGLAEVPTPYGSEVNGLAFNWYLRRR